MTNLQTPVTLHWASTPTPFGDCFAMATARGVCWVGTPGTAAEVGFAWARRHFTLADVVADGALAPLAIAMDELRRYYDGERLHFTCPIDLHGTAFQTQVWQALCAIPFGETRSYGDIAREIGRPTAVRAVGAANGANPVPIIVPCHRVIGSSGALTGYGGGLPVKSWLLALERGTA